QCIQRRRREVEESEECQRSSSEENKEEREGVSITRMKRQSPYAPSNGALDIIKVLSKLTTNRA
ncbi:hypothetical protein AAVH_36176, partial [Aphelenchoides avenae]